MRTHLVGVPSVVLDDDAGLGHAEHEFPVQALVSQRAVEALHVPVLPGTGWLDVEGFDVTFGQPALQGAGDELAAIIAADVGGHPSLDDQSFHDFNEVVGGELAGDVEGQALAAVLVDDREDAQLASIVGAVTDGSPNSRRG